MSTTQLTQRAPYIPRRAGPGRVVVHIILFTLIGALALGLGLMGRQRLAGKVDQMQNTRRPTCSWTRARQSKGRGG